MFMMIQVYHGPRLIKKIQEGSRWFKKVSVQKDLQTLNKMLGKTILEISRRFNRVQYSLVKFKKDKQKGS